MAVLEVCRRRLKAGIEPNDERLISALPQVRERTGAKYVFYSAMEEPEAFLQIGEWSSLEAYKQFEASSERDHALLPLNDLSNVEWIEHMPIDSIDTLPIKAPVMSASRCFFKEYDNHPQIYEKEMATLVPAINNETKPWRFVDGWTVDTTPNHHKYIVFAGWRSKKHHQEFATKLRNEYDFFSRIPEHYDEGTVHRHCWNMETKPGKEIFETLQGFIPQKITEART